jgi:hypothetical protein
MKVKDPEKWLIRGSIRKKAVFHFAPPFQDN